MSGIFSPLCTLLCSNALFSTTDLDFLPKLQDLQGKEFSTTLENFTQIFSLVHELQLLQHFVSYFTVTVTCDVLCSASLKFFLKACSECPSHLSHKLSVFLSTSVWPYWLSPSAAGPILTARLSSVHQCFWLVVKFDRLSSLQINSLQLVAIQSWANIAVWAGIVSCWGWEMNTDARRDLHSLIWATEFNGFTKKFLCNKFRKK